MRERDTTIALRTTQDTKKALQKLTKVMGDNLGTRITQTQAMEIAIREALASRSARTP